MPVNLNFIIPYTLPEKVQEYACQCFMEYLYSECRSGRNHGMKVDIEQTSLSSRD